MLRLQDKINLLSLILFNIAWLRHICGTQTVDAEPLKFTAFDRVEVLSESLPYLQAFRGKTIVVKYGGAAMKDPSLMVRASLSTQRSCK